MRKLISLAVATAMTLALVACSNSPETVADATSTVVEEVTEEAVEVSEAVEETAEEVAEEVVEEATEAVALTVAPLPAIEDVNDATLWAALNMDSFDGENIDVNLYSEQYYDAVDMSMLKAGDTIMVNGEAITVSDVTTNGLGLMMINGGIEEGGAEFMAMEAGGIYQYSGMDGYPTYDDLGSFNLKVSPDVVITDASDLENPDGTVLSIDEFKDFAGSHELTRLNTSVRTEGGVIVEINIRYIP